MKTGCPVGSCFLHRFWTIQCMTYFSMFERIKRYILDCKFIIFYLVNEVILSQIHLCLPNTRSFELSRFILGLIMLLRGVNLNDRCSWCHYLSCVPTARWSCKSKSTYCEVTNLVMFLMLWIFVIRLLMWLHCTFLWFLAWGLNIMLNEISGITYTKAFVKKKECYIAWNKKIIWGPQSGFLFSIVQ